jgi:selenide,water dikinase
MVEKSGYSVRLDTTAVPLIAEALEFAAMGLIPAGAYKNREFREKMIQRGPDVNREVEDLLYDPQTSGGLLIGVAESHAESLVAALKAGGIEVAADIGEVIDGPEEIIYLT